MELGNKTPIFPGNSSNVIGPAIFRAKLVTQKTQNVFIVFKFDAFYLLFSDENSPPGQQNVNRIMMEVKYSNIASIENNIKIITIKFNEEPFWEYAIPCAQPPKFQKSGFSTISISSKKQHIQMIKSEIYSHATNLLSVTVFQPQSITRQSISVPFSVPTGLFGSISLYTTIAHSCISSEGPHRHTERCQKCFLEKYNFELEFTNERLMMECIDPLYALKNSQTIHYNNQIYPLYRSPFQFLINLDYATVTGKESEKFVSDPPATVSIFRTSSAIHKIPIEHAMHYLHEFLVSELWQKTEFEYDHMQSVNFCMTQIYNRETWTCPCITFETKNTNFGVFSINALKSDNFARVFRNSQNFGKFKKGISTVWLPDCYHSIFLFEIKNDFLHIHNIEFIGWDFDPEINHSTKESFAIQRSYPLGNFISFIQNKL